MCVMMILYLECYLLIEGASGCSLDFLRANKGMKLRLVRTRESPKKFHDCKELGKNAEARTFFLKIFWS